MGYEYSWRNKQVGAVKAKNGNTEVAKLNNKVLKKNIRAIRGIVKQAVA